jgi:hypothetical protein
MRRVNRRVRASNNFGDYIIGDIERAGLLPAWTDILDLKTRAEQSSIAQNDFGYAVSDGGDLYRVAADLGRVAADFGPVAANLEGERLSITERHIFAPFPLKLSNSFPDCLGTKTGK